VCCVLIEEGEFASTGTGKSGPWGHNKESFGCVCKQAQNSVAALGLPREKEQRTGYHHLLLIPPPPPPLLPRPQGRALERRDEEQGCLGRSGCCPRCCHRAAAERLRGMLLRMLRPRGGGGATTGAAHAQTLRAVADDADTDHRSAGSSAAAWPLGTTTYLKLSAKVVAMVACA